MGANNEQHDRSIVTSIQKMSGTFNLDTVSLVTGTVDSVDEGNGTCNVTALSGSASTNINNVELQTTIADGVLFIPVVGSEVKVLMSKYTTPFIVQFSDIDKMYISGNLIQFNDGGFGGLVKVAKLTDKLNKLENDLNVLKSALAAWVPVPMDGGAALKVVTASWYGNHIVPTIRAEIENKNVKHG